MNPPEEMFSRDKARSESHLGLPDQLEWKRKMRRHCITRSNIKGKRETCPDLESKGNEKKSDNELLFQDKWHFSS